MAASVMVSPSEKQPVMGDQEMAEALFHGVGRQEEVSRGMSAIQKLTPTQRFFFTQYVVGQVHLEILAARWAADPSSIGLSIVTTMDVLVEVGDVPAISSILEEARKRGFGGRVIH